jgi:hypothetical protein
MDLSLANSCSIGLKSSGDGSTAAGCPVGFMKVGDRYEKDPDRRVQAAILLVFDKIEELGSARQAPCASVSGNDRIAMIIPIVVSGNERLAMTVPVQTANANGALQMRSSCQRNAAAKPHHGPWIPGSDLSQLQTRGLEACVFSVCQGRHRRKMRSVRRSGSGMPFSLRLFADPPAQDRR